MKGQKRSRIRLNGNLALTWANVETAMKEVALYRFYMEHKNRSYTITGMMRSDAIDFDKWIPIERNGKIIFLNKSDIVYIEEICG